MHRCVEPTNLYFLNLGPHIIIWGGSGNRNMVYCDRCSLILWHLTFRKFKVSFLHRFICYSFKYCILNSVCLGFILHIEEFPSCAKVLCVYFLFAYLLVVLSLNCWNPELQWPTCTSNSTQWPEFTAISLDGSKLNIWKITASQGTKGGHWNLVWLVSFFLLFIFPCHCCSGLLRNLWRVYCLFFFFNLKIIYTDVL